MFPVTQLPRRCFKSVALLERSVIGLRPCSSSAPCMPACDIEPSPYQGFTPEKLQTIRRDHLNPGILTYYKQPVLVNQGYMQWLWDHKGKRYLDLIGGIVTVSVGHCHPKTVQALTAQAQLLWHTTNIYWHPAIHEYAEKLVAKLPERLKVVYFVNSGSEANDLAMLMMRLYTGRYDVISLRNAYHGASPYLMGLTALSSWRYQLPTGFGIKQTMNADPYRGPWGGANCRDSPVQTDRKCSCSPGSCVASDNYVDQLSDVLRFSVPKAGVAGMFAEPIQGVGGTVQFPKGYLKRAFELIHNAGGLCVADEVQTGFGRTGEHFWGFQMHDVMPDIVTLAKGIGNGIPLAAVVTSPEIADTLSTKNGFHFNTFGGNPLSCAVGSTVLDILEEDGCQETSHVVGTYLLTELAKLREEFAVVGDVRGKGLMIGLELVSDKETRTPLEASEVSKIFETCKEMGVLMGKGGLFGNVLRMKPPMCITKEDADFAVAVIRRVFQEHNVA